MFYRIVDFGGYLSIFKGKHNAHETFSFFSKK